MINYFFKDTEEFEIPDKWKEKILEITKGMEANIIFCSDEYIKELNSQYRNKSYPTDVLSFAYKEGEIIEQLANVLGDIYISVPTAKKQAEEYEVSFLEEIKRLIVHGVFHLLGYDHQTEKTREDMEKQEEKLRDELQ